MIVRLGRARWLPVLGVLALTACPRSEERPAVDAAADLPDVAPHDAPTVPSAPTAAPTPSPALVPLPEPPEGVDPVAFALLASVCATAAYRLDSGKLLVGCASWPPFDAPEKGPRATVQVAEDPTQVCQLEGLHRGSFSRPDAREIVLELSACADGDAYNGGMPGSLVLVEETTDGRARVVATEPWAPHGACSVAHARGRGDRLVCLGWQQFMVGGNAVSLVAYDFQKPDTQRVQRISLLDNGGNVVCDESSLVNGLVSAQLSAPSVKDEDGDGLDDVTVEVRRAHWKPSKVEAERRLASCKRRQEYTVDCSDAFPKSGRFKLVLRGAPDTLRPDVTTQALLDQWTAQIPEDLRDMVLGASK